MRSCFHYCLCWRSWIWLVSWVRGWSFISFSMISKIYSQCMKQSVFVSYAKYPPSTEENFQKFRCYLVWSQCDRQLSTFWGIESQCLAVMSLACSQQLVQKNRPNILLYITETFKYWQLKYIIILTADCHWLFVEINIFTDIRPLMDANAGLSQSCLYILGINPRIHVHVSNLMCSLTFRHT